MQKSPRLYGIQASAWVIPDVNQVVTRLTGHALCDERVRQLLHEYGFATTRAKHHLVSPDPDFDRKKGRSTPLNRILRQIRS